MIQGFFGGLLNRQLIYQTDLPSFQRDFASLKTLDHGTGPAISFTRGSNATYFDANGVLQTAGNNVPRFDHNPSSGASLGLLIEEARTNSIRNSQAGGAVVGAPGTAPTNWAVSATSNGLSREIVATGTVNGLAYVDIRWSGTTSSASGSQAHFEAATQIAATAGDTWTGSAYVQLVSGSLSGITWAIQNWYHDSGGVYIGFNQTTFTPTSSLVRVSHTGAVAATATRIRNCVQFFYGSGQAVDLTLRIAAPQLEQGAFPTSYIPTTTAAATRAADSAVVTPISSFYNQAEGTLFAEASRYQVASGGQLFGFRDTDSNLVSIVYGIGAPTQMRFDVSNTTSQAQLPTSTSAVAGTTYKHGAAYAVNDFEYYLNGARTGTGDQFGTLPSVTTMAIGAGRNTSGGTFGQNNGHIRKIAYWPKRLTNTLLQQITT